MAQRKAAKSENVNFELVTEDPATVGLKAAFKRWIVKCRRCGRLCAVSDATIRETAPRRYGCKACVTEAKRARKAAL